MIPLLINALSYQVIWFTAILWGNSGAILGCTIIILALITSKKRIADLKILAFLGAIGCIVDGVLLYIGFYTFTQSGFPIPFWLLIIWLGLATTIHHSLSWLKGRLYLSALFGAIGGPLAYWAGTRMGAATFNYPLPLSLLILVILWALLFPILMVFAQHSKKT